MKSEHKEQMLMFDFDVPLMPILDVSRCYTRPIRYETVRPILLEHHYLHRNCQAIINVGMFVDNVLAGVCCFGSTISSVSDAICGKQYRHNVLDLNRLYLFDWAGKNSESWLIGQSFKWLRKLHPNRFILISYASIDNGHIGIVYQATNWLYTGQSSTGLKFEIKGQEKTARAVMARYGTVSKLKLTKIFGDKVQWFKTTPKNRYVYFLGSKYQKRELRKRLKWNVLPYPKTIEEINETRA